MLETALCGIAAVVAAGTEYEKINQSINLIYAALGIKAKL
jgi:hypothetical protein